MKDKIDPICNGVFYFGNMENIEKIYSFLVNGGKAVIDSRLVEEGDVFFALKGETVDGNLFAKEALAKGAAIAVIDNPSQAAEGAILVPDSLKCLQRVAHYHRKQLGIPVLAITGSNGKTTTKELLSAVLSKKFFVTFTKGNLNNHIGVPLTILSFDRNSEFGVVEMGANHKREIGELAEIAEPDYGIITNIGKAHLEGFGSVEGIMEGKGELYDFLSRHGGLAFYNADSTLLSKMVSTRTKMRTLPYSKEVLGATVVDSPAESPYLCVEIEDIGLVNTHLFGDYNVENILAAASVGRYFGIANRMIKEAIEGFVPSNNRSQIAKTAHNIVLLDCYNANPSSMRSALAGVVQVDHPSKVAILGDMLELGNFSLAEHKEMVELALQCGFQKILLVGPMFTKASEGISLLSFNSYKELEKHLEEMPVINSFVLVKGSRGIQLERIFDKL
ncbi:MAG TPA: UDP-N-acetylmuramoyl-tripeptide--D-alanyl-D-alanine ligase [Williamwhitmania sp.]|nr:UDP-N-acetylmuramoyl-tripeptide--D-alanyl-D-alanine ligase [Williamwhitmania sp.]